MLALFGQPVERVILQAPPKLNMGDLATPVALELAKVLKRKPREIAEQLANGMTLPVFVASVSVEGAGYLNFRFDRGAFTAQHFRTVMAPPRPSGERVIVEHTNINPNKAAHIGHLRNSVLGDTYVRCSKWLGDHVETQNYIDDTGVQVADVVVGFRELEACESDIRRRARAVIDQLERENRIGIVVLARPYHHDPGLNHEILEEFQKLGYPVFAQDSLPIDDDILWRLFGEEVERGDIRHPLDIGDVWKNSYSENTSRKVWAAKYTARHPNLVALELSSFKCGHDAPIYATVEEIVQKSGTPYFCFKDIDENKPTGSIKIRVETIGYFLQRYREDMVRAKERQRELDARMAEFERRLRAEMESGQEVSVAAGR